MRELLKAWRQGHIAQTDQLHLCDDIYSHAVLISQDCDIVAVPDVEPAAEYVLAKIVTTADPSLAAGKNPRRLQLQLLDGSYLELDLRRRGSVSKDQLLEAQPSAITFKKSDLNVLARWLGKRYSRASFPDEFNRRIEKQANRLSRLSKKEAAIDISAVFVSLDPPLEDLRPEVLYQVILWIACPVEVYENATKLVEVEALATSFADAFRACDGISLLEVEVRSHADITLADLETLKKMDFDYRSLDEGEIVEDV
jgi:hypothetical protein